MSTPHRKKRKCAESPDQLHLFLAPPTKTQQVKFEPVVLPPVPPSGPPPTALVLTPPPPPRKSVHIRHGDTGHTYENLFGEYLVGAKHITVEDAFVRTNNQINNFLRFCELVVRVGVAQVINLTTGYADERGKVEVEANLKLIASSLIERGIKLNLVFDANLHDREIRLDNGWTIKIGRGFDIYQRPKSRFEVGVFDLAMRPCLQTNVDILRR